MRRPLVFLALLTLAACSRSPTAPPLVCASLDTLVVNGTPYLICRPPVHTFP